MEQSVKVKGVSYRRLSRKCGKPGCKCNIPGQEHGPYWYAFDGNSAAKYIGAKLPEHITQHMALLKASKPKLKALREKILDRRDKAQQDLERANRELTALSNLEAGEYTASQVLKSLGLAQFNGGER